jgi:phage recombination protein Bet
MNQIALRKEQNSQKLMLLDYMADKYSLTADEFRKTVRATCGLDKATPEQVAAFLIVAKEYNLNPLTKEIYAFPGRGGGVVPIVSIDGWVNLVNSHPQCDGFDFAVETDPETGLFAMTCTMHRKDRKHPTIVTEYLSECIRATEPWKMKHRMLRHKSFIQAARYAFGFAGIYDEDEGRVIAEATDVAREEPPAPPPLQIASPAIAAPVEPEIIQERTPAPGDLPSPAGNPDAFIKAMFGKFAAAKTADELKDLWERHVETNKQHLFPPDEEDLMGAYRRREGKLV